MPGFDGTGPQGKGPLTGRGHGYCLLRESGDRPGQVQGFAGVGGVPFVNTNEAETEPEKEVIQMPFGNGTGPAGRGPMTGRGAGFGAGFPLPGYRNPIGLWGPMSGFGRRSVGPYGAVGYGYPGRYAPAYMGWLGRWLGRGFGLAWRFGRGRGRRGGGRRFGLPY